MPRLHPTWQNAVTLILLFDTAGHVPVQHDELPATLRAGSVAGSGLVLCRSVIEVTEEICNYGLFTVSRIRLDHDFRMVSVRAPAATLAATRLQGTAPPACNAAGTGYAGHHVDSWRGACDGHAARPAGRCRHRCR